MQTTFLTTRPTHDNRSWKVAACGVTLFCWAGSVLMGLRGRYLDTRGMDAPLLEYDLQIPSEFGGAKQAGYRSNWNYVRELPIIKYYYAEQQRDTPKELEVE